MANERLVAAMEQWLLAYSIANQPPSGWRNDAKALLTALAAAIRDDPAAVEALSKNSALFTARCKQLLGALCDYLEGR